MTMAESRDHPDWWRPVGGSNAVDSVLERRSLIANHGAVALWEVGSLIIARGKFFTRGMRGFLEDIEIYCRDPLAAGGTMTVNICPFPESGTLYTANIVVPAGGGAAWRAAAFDLFWNYDSMFIWWYEQLIGDVEYGYDVEQPWDGYWGGPTGIIWVTRDLRYWVRVLMAGQTPGDVPVSGTLNVVPIPNTVSDMDYVTVAINGPDTGDIIGDPAWVPTAPILGMGQVTCLMMTLTQIAGVVPAANMEIHVVTDGNDLNFTVAELIAAVSGVINTPTPITMGIITPATNIYQVSFNLKFPFRLSLQVYVENTAAAGNNMMVEAIYSYELLA